LGHRERCPDATASHPLYATFQDKVDPWVLLINHTTNQAIFLIYSIFGDIISFHTFQQAEHANVANTFGKIAQVILAVFSHTMIHFTANA